MQFGNLSSDDIRILLMLLPRLEQEERVVRQILIQERGRLFSSDCLNFSWSHLYEYPFLEHVARMVVSFGMGDELNAIAKSSSQVQAMYSVIKEFENDETEFTPEEREELRPAMATILGVVTSLLRSLQCLMAYGCYLNDLLVVVRAGGVRGDKALLKAIRIDPTVIGAPTALRRISQATLEDDKPFLGNVKKAINGGLSKQDQANSKKIRLVLQVLREAGAERLSNDELYKLFVEELNLYAAPKKADIGDAAKGIRAIEDRMKKAKATT